MDKTIYVCTGTCGAQISEKQYLDGLTACRAKGCMMEGHHFEKRFQCAKCGELYKTGEIHNHK